MNSMIQYAKESYNELINYVTWPTLGQLLESTRIVLIASVIFTLLIALMNFVSNTVLEAVYGL